ncbi:class C sortase [Microbacterium sp.]|uniref:class C sortase n=1 Tax=Microbacterium sp. TaxID=51671 RepID=UPI00262C0A21|nr:class C sortase [Microbacterium sp.]
MSATMAMPPTRRGRRRLSRRRWSPVHLFAALAMLLGASILLYPSAAQWLSDRAHATEVSGYVERVEAAPPAELQRLLAEAKDYNTRLPQGPLRDPYVLTEAGSPAPAAGDVDYYNAQLSTGLNAPMARVRIPEISLDLPVYHGTDPATLDKGIGHLLGSSVPTGGLDTHAVLTGHSGLPGARLFTDLHELKVGDRFFIEVAGQTLTYEIDQILTVTPEDAELLRRDPNGDYVTLLTCTPTGINTHRLLVRGARVETVSSGLADETLPPDVAEQAFPWWIVALTASAVAAGWLARPRRRLR